MFNVARTRPAPAVRHPNRHKAAVTAADLQAALILRQAGASTRDAADAARVVPGLTPAAAAMREMAQ